MTEITVVDSDGISDEERARELRVVARLAWNNWPDNAESRREIAVQDAKAIGGNEAWDRVAAAIKDKLRGGQVVDL